MSSDDLREPMAQEIKREKGRENRQSMARTDRLARICNLTKSKVVLKDLSVKVNNQVQAIVGI